VVHEQTSFQDRAVNATGTIFLLGPARSFPKGLDRRLARQGGLKVCGIESDSLKALAEIPRLQPELALVHLSNPDQAVTLLKLIRAAAPRIKVLVHSDLCDPAFADQVLQAGADGYICEQQEAEEIVNAVRDVLTGHLYVSEQALLAEPAEVVKKSKKKPSRKRSRR